MHICTDAICMTVQGCVRRYSCTAISKLCARAGDGLHGSLWAAHRNHTIHSKPLWEGQCVNLVGAEKGASRDSFRVRPTFSVSESRRLAFPSVGFGCQKVTETS